MEPKTRPGVDGHMSATRIDQTDECRLLALPGELRNHIYRYAVVESEKVTVKPHSPPPPALLSVCRSIREDCGTIYYCENIFELELEEYNGAPFAPFHRTYQDFTRNINVTNQQTFFDGAPNWENLVAWLRSEYDHPTGLPKMVLQDDNDPDLWVVAGAFDIAEALKESEWSIVEAALRGLYTGLKGTSSAWVKEGDRVLE